MTAVLMNQGINEMQTLANSGAGLGDASLQKDINLVSASAGVAGGSANANASIHTLYSAWMFLKSMSILYNYTSAYMLC